LGTPNLSRHYQLESMDSGYLAQGIFDSGDFSRGVVLKFRFGLDWISLCAA
jgi:hypothetical protein